MEEKICIGFDQAMYLTFVFSSPPVSRNIVVLGEWGLQVTAMGNGVTIVWIPRSPRYSKLLQITMLFST